MLDNDSYYSVRSDPLVNFIKEDLVLRYFSKFKVQNLLSDSYSSRIVDFEMMHGALLDIEPKVIFDRQGMKYPFQEREAKAIISYLNELGRGKASYELIVHDPKPIFRKARV